MVVVVPAFPHGDQTGQGDIASLHAGAAHVPVMGLVGVRQVADQPVAGDGDGDLRADAPENPGPAAQREEQDGPRNVLRHPVTVNELVESVIGDFGLYDDARRPGQADIAMHLPDGVDQGRLAMRKVVVAMALALRPVALVVGADESKRPAKPHQRTHVDHDAFQPQRAVEALMN